VRDRVGRCSPIGVDATMSARASLPVVMFVRATARLLGLRLAPTHDQGALRAELHCIDISLHAKGTGGSFPRRSFLDRPR
jgi:hypothetical protein